MNPYLLFIENMALFFSQSSFFKLCSIYELEAITWLSTGFNLKYLKLTDLSIITKGLLPPPKRREGGRGLINYTKLD